jgi:hypothetical protein
MFAETARSSWTLAALIALTTVDVLAARHFLDARSAGEYALAALFAKVTFWGTQFVALLIVPRMPHAGSRRVLGLALGAVLATGLTVSGVVLLDPEWWATAAGGPEYADAGTLAVWFTLLGTAWALIQLLVFGQLGRNVTGMALIVWGSTMLQLLVTISWLHHSASEIVAAAALGAATCLAAGLVETMWPKPAGS